MSAKVARQECIYILLHLVRHMERVTERDRPFNRGNKKNTIAADTTCRRISEMSQDIKCQLIDKVKRGKYALQLDESTNVSGLAQLIVFLGI